MCIYCIILMTWVSFSSPCPLPSANQQLIWHIQVQLLLPHVPRLLHHLYAHAKATRQFWCFEGIDYNEDWGLRRWNNHRLSVTICGTSSGYRRFGTDIRHPHSSMDSANRRASTQRYRLLYAILRSRCMGCHPNPPERAVSTRFPIIVPGYHVPGW